MNLTMQRVKQGGYECDLSTDNKSLAETINLIVDTELNWGGKVTDHGDKLVINTVVFGDTDTTTITGTVKEIEAMRTVCAVYRTGKTKAVIRHVFQIMGFEYEEGFNYNFDEVCLVYKMWLENDSRSPELITLITKKPVPPKKEITQKEIDEVMNLKKVLDLDKSDGANLVLTSSLICK